MASGMHSQHVADLNYGGGAFKLAREGDTFVGISAASDLHPQPATDFNCNGGAFKLAHEGDALIRESWWPPIPNIIIR
jgi:hypothetical protein